MKAIGYQHNLSVTDEDCLINIEIPEPVPKGRDLLVAVKAVSVNPVDYKIRQNKPVSEGEWQVLGYDATGIVVSVGENVTHFTVGDKVWYAGDITRSGTNAEYQLVDERIVGKMPRSIGFAEAAALPLTAITAWEMLFDRLQIDAHDKDKSILVIGAAGGVGSIMVQLIKNLTKLHVIATASRPETKAWLEGLGADKVINHRAGIASEFANQNITEVDYVVSLNQTQSHIKDIVEIIRPQGKFGLIDDPETLDIVAFKTKSVSVHWELMFTRSMFSTPDMIKQHELLNTISELIDSGTLKTTLGEHMGNINAANLRKAHAQLESGTAKGKLVLENFKTG